MGIQRKTQHSLPSGCSFANQNSVDNPETDLMVNGMGASVELLRAINKSGLKVCEVPISCKYAGSTGEKTSSKNPLSHGVGLIMSLIKTSRRRQTPTLPWITRHNIFGGGRFVRRLDDGYVRGVRSNCY